MVKQKYKVIQVREVEVEASNPMAAKILANRAFYGNKPAKADPEGTVLSVVHVKETNVHIHEGV